MYSSCFALPKYPPLLLMLQDELDEAAAKELLDMQTTRQEEIARFATGRVRPRSLDRLRKGSGRTFFCARAQNLSLRAPENRYPFAESTRQWS